MYIRKTSPSKIETSDLKDELSKLRREKKARNQKGHTLGRFKALATRIARRLFVVRQELRDRGALAA